MSSGFEYAEKREENQQEQDADHNVSEIHSAYLRRLPDRILLPRTAASCALQR